MAQLTFDDGSPRHPLSDHDIALVMAVLRLAGKPNDFPQTIEHEYSRCVETLKLIHQESRS
jgi:hypothetical protein